MERIKNMAKITQKQVDTLNARCRNGFRFDLQTFMERGEKQLCKLVTLEEDKKIVKVGLYWKDEVVKRRNEYGCIIPEYTGNVIPALHCAVWRTSETTSCWVSHGLGSFHEFRNAPSAKRLMNALCDMTSEVTDELICGMLPENEREAFQQKVVFKQEKP